jgi:membrane complex biogenesis BtpA family protein
MSAFREVFADDKIVIGMIHLPPLPDYPNSPGIEAIVEHALRDLATLEAAGVHGVLIENEHDRPHRVEASKQTISAMTTVTGAVVSASRSALVGCEILLNDPQASLTVASRSGAAFIRTDYFVDRMLRPGYGEFAIDAEGLLNFRSEMGADDVLILADIQVKYATMVEPRPLSESAHLAAQRGADAVVVTGDASGDAPRIEHLRNAACDVPVLIGSGLSPHNAPTLLAECDGAIVGTSILRDGSVDAGALSALMARVGSA